ncbi:hypothetical protein H9Y04_38540 [Streptomyces sp. TRM66268-LWL]|uniref:Uncharacterized protein n=1 Tax=Streptomyces polyasparticus TaxID=2767826 RepID=A0ABR7SU67_9ACTN|nr:hypothetical protein [Streptomyces polyasparticus]MBC9718439.1 hypothetical protein [Streptomyces polyasparticus]
MPVPEHIPDHCPGCQQEAHEAAAKQQAAEKTRQEAEDRAADGPMLVWALLAAVLLLAVGSVVPYLVWRYQ